MKDHEFEAILCQALQPPVLPEDTVVLVRPSGKRNGITMKKLMKRVCIAAAVVVLLATTAYAAGEMNIKTLLGGMNSRVYNSVAQAEEKAGFTMDDLDSFSNGYAFSGAYVGQTKALDDGDTVRLVYNEIHVDLVNAAGEKLSLIAHESHDALEGSSLAPERSRRYGDVQVSYRVDHYKYVPADYVPTEADKAMLQQPGWYLSYGAEEVGETDVAFLRWEKEGISYLLMDMDAGEPTDSLFSMAEELISSGK